MSNCHKSVRIVIFCVAYGTESLSVLFLLGFCKKRQKYGTLSKEFLGFIVTPKGEYVKKYNKCFAFFVLLEKKQNGRREENLTNMFHYSGNYLPRNTV